MPQRMNDNIASPSGMKALGGAHGYVARSEPPACLVDAVYLRPSQINGCACCIDMHSRELLEARPPVEHLVPMPVWREARTSSVRWSGRRSPGRKPSPGRPTRTRRTTHDKRRPRRLGRGLPS
jgi:AhpD family alkylhydroperoxidase